MKKMSTYHRLKLENKRLKFELRNVIVNPNSVKSMLVIARVWIEDGLEKAAWFGSTKIVK